MIKSGIGERASGFAGASERGMGGRSEVLRASRSPHIKKKATILALVKDVAKAADKIKAVDLKILDLRKLSTFADFFIVASGTSDRHVEAIADSIVREMKKKGYYPIGVEGYGRAQWVLVDFGDIVAHIFYGPMREIYSIEKLWADAREVKGERSKVKGQRKRCCFDL